MNYVRVWSADYPECATEFRVSEVRTEKSGLIAFCVNAGPTSLQTYATRDELRALGELLLRTANENEVLEVAA